MITLLGNPKSTNNLYKYGKHGMYMTGAGAQLKKDYQWETYQDWKKEPIEGRIKMKIRFYFGDKRKRDLDNFNKIILDALEGIVFENDSQIDHLTLIRDYDKNNPRAEINIKEI